MDPIILKYIEKRIFKRLETEIPVELEVNGQKLKATTVNISCGGMFLNVDPERLKTEDSFQVIIHLPKRHKPVKLVGQTRRRQLGEAPGVALEFQGLYDDGILAIESFVKAHLN